LNSRPVAWEKLSDEFKSHLKYHAEWVVYVAADPGLLWGDAMNAMDIIRGTGARIVLLTTTPNSSHVRSANPQRN